jgi:CHAT domain-containing protein
MSRVAESPGEGQWAETRALENMRVMLARLEAAGDSAAGGPRAAAVRDQLDVLRRQYLAAGTSVPDARGLERIIGSIGADEAVLSYYFDPDGAHVLMAAAGQVRLARVGAADRVAADIEAARMQLGQNEPAVVDLLEELGETLLGPLGERLPRDIYFLPSGPLGGFPMDALMLSGRHLAEDHRLVNLSSISSLEGPRTGVRGDYGEKVFLAGNPQQEQGPFRYEVNRSAEISAVNDIFIGPGLHVVQGVALQRDEFQDPRFEEAGLIHLAAPGTLDLVRPERSRLLLGGSREGSAAAFLVPADIRGFSFRAGLVVLSQTAVSGGSATVFSAKLGFVSEFLENGASTVIASLWAPGDRAAAAFMGDFYSSLGRDLDAASALMTAKRRRIDAQNGQNLADWAGFQLFIR